MFAQLALDGSELPLDEVGRPVVGQAALALELLRERGGCVGPSELGRALHASGARRCWEPHLPGALGCCEAAATDGRRVLLRLADRGRVERVSRGVYVLLGA